MSADKSPPKKNHFVSVILWSGIASAILTIFLLASLPYTTAGENGELEQALQKLHMLEHQMRRLASLAEYKLPDQVALCGKPVPINRQDVREALEREFYYSLDNHDVAILWIKRAAKYFPYIESRLKSRAMPDDLKYMAVAESDLKVEALSFAGAGGMWQIMPQTARHCGLRVDRYLDERRDFVKSTEAALGFLDELYKTFGDWHLAIAAYNGGPGRVASEMKEQKVSNYYDLNLPRETERYVFRVAAIKIIMSQPANYGLDFPPEELYPPLKFDTVTMNVPEKSIYIGDIAAAAGATFKQVVEMNPALESFYLPRGVYQINLPPGASAGFSKTWAQPEVSQMGPTVSPQPLPAKRLIHVVKRGETMASISRKYNVTISDLCKWNNLNQRAKLNSGRRLVIFIR